VTPKRIAALVLFDLAALLIVAGLAALSIWQLDRRAWKLDLIARVEARTRAPLVPAPGRERWSEVAAEDEYARVTVTGRWREERPALAQASTKFGGGHWVMAFFARDDGTTVLVNRGFAPAEARDPAAWRAPPAGRLTLTGLLRLSEPHGGFLRVNDPGADRWHSRDVAAIAAARGVPDVAPYFVDADAVAGAQGWPAAGLTTLVFRNDHLVYAVTWGVLAAMAAAGAVAVNVEALARSRRRLRVE
jgi:surfeit locus 1 family protein